MNIIFVSCDTLRADHLGCYGYPKATSPHIDRIAQEGVLFENAFAANIPTEPAHTAIFSGRLGIETGIVAHGEHNRYLSRSVPWLPSLLWEAGFTTAACDNLYRLKEWFVRGFRHYINTATKTRWIDGKDVNAEAIRWLRHHREEPFFLFLHYWDAHTPYLPPEKYRSLFYQGDPFDPSHSGMERVKAQPIYPFFHEFHFRHLGPVTDPEYVSALYDAEIRYLDDLLRELDEFLEELGLAERTLLVLVGDHGESLYEHDIFWDHAGLYDATVKVPLIMRWPGRIPEGLRIDALVQHVDIFPTLLEAANVPCPEGGAGKSLWPLIHGEEEAFYSALYLAECSWQASQAVRTREWKLIHNVDPGVYQRPPFELYRLSDDPEESRNLAEDEPEVVEALYRELLVWMDRKLGKGVDPMRSVLAETGMPVVHRLNRTLAKWGLTWQEWRANPDLRRLGIE